MKNLTATVLVTTLLAAIVFRIAIPVTFIMALFGGNWNRFAMVVIISLAIEVFFGILKQVVRVACKTR